MRDRWGFFLQVGRVERACRPNLWKKVCFKRVQRLEYFIECCTKVHFTILGRKKLKTYLSEIQKIRKYRKLCFQISRLSVIRQHKNLKKITKVQGIL